MDLIIIDQNIAYAKTLREFCVNSSKFKNVIIFRTLKELLDSVVPRKGILLFEHTLENEKFLETANLSTNQLSIVAFVNNKIPNEYNLIKKGVSTIISKNEKLESILEQLNLVVKGKRILTKESFEGIRHSQENNDTVFQRINKSISKLFNYN